MRNATILLAALALAGCTLIERDNNPYDEKNAPVYNRFLNTGSQLDRQILSTLDALRANPQSAPLHNDLGQLLLQKGFPKDAEREFERAINADSRFYPAWYNLGLVRAARGDYSGARRAFWRTTRIMKGHAEALFQLGMMEEKHGNRDTAIGFYAKAIRHNPAITDVRVNPLVLDSNLIHLALIENYDRDHVRQAGRYLGTPAGYVPPLDEDIVTPTAPVTDTGTQQPPPKP
jgi:tetratricopeptide (TPR) repeat protein